MKQFGRWLGTLMLVTGVVFGVTIFAHAEVIASGTCEENISWELDGNGQLTISGTGEVQEWYPWYDYQDDIFSVVIEDGVTAISPNMDGFCIPSFDSHAYLKQVSIADSVTYIGECAFRGCSSLSKVKLPQYLTIIRAGTFNDCRSLLEIQIPHGVTTIEYNAFMNCDSLREIAIPDTVTSIGNHAFSDCDRLTTIVIPQSLTSIGYGVFYSCTELDAIVFLGDAPQLDYYTFNGATCTVYYPTANASWIEVLNQEYAGNITWQAYEGDFPVLEAPDSGIVSSGICGENLTWTLDHTGTVTVSGTGPMYNYSWNYAQQSPWYDDVGITALVVEDGVTTIGNTAFEGCINLEQITLADSVTRIGESAFMYCWSLNDVELPDSVHTIDWRAFYCCTALEEIKLPDYMNVLGANAFFGCKKLRSIAVPEGIMVLDSATFSGCDRLFNVELPSTLLSIYTDAFSNCKKLESIDIPDGVCVIEGSAFSCCSNLKSISLPASVQVLGDGQCGGPFIACDSLRSIEIPYGVQEIQDNTFNGCRNLQSITIPVTVERIQVASFINCESLKDVYFTGDEEQWNQITIDPDNDPLQNATVHFLNTEEKTPNVGNSLVRLTEGIHADWEDRVVLPGPAQTFYDWLEESTDGDGIDDTLIEILSDTEYMEENDCAFFYECTIPVQAENRSELEVNLAREYCAEFEAFQIAFEIYEHDHPETTLFIGVSAISGEKVVLDDQNGKIEIIFDLYLTRSGISTEEYYGHLSDLEIARDRVLSDIPENLSVYEQVRCFNAYLTQNNGYNSGEDFPGSAHQAITALIGKNDTEGPVCEAYAKAFKILCDARNIPCEYITSLSHAWNAVQMEDGDWYAVDVTWNDPVKDPQSSNSGYETEDYLLVGNETQIQGQRFCDRHEPLNNAAWILFFDNGPILAKTEYIPSESAGHIEVPIAAIAPTCTEDGYTTGSRCYICGEVFRAPERIPALGGTHVEVIDLAVAPTCTSPGLTEGKHCSVCQAVLVAQEAVAALKHTFAVGSCVVCGEEDPNLRPGDINGDGAVNNKDATRLFQYMTGWRVEVAEAALDVNGDGKVNNKDATRLFQYLSGWNVKIY